MEHHVGNRVVGKLIGAGISTNPMNRFGRLPEGKAMTSRIRVPEGWKHIDTKFGLQNHEAEAHRKALSMIHGGLVRKVLANFKVKEWHFHLKVR
jgi:hypothetical protein